MHHSTPTSSTSPLRITVAHLPSRHARQDRKSGAPGDQDRFNPVRGEEAMWQAVITQALMDAASKSPKAEARRAKEEALRWLRGFSEDFVSVCLNAGMDPDYVKRMVNAALKRGCKWRADAGENAKKRKRKERVAVRMPLSSPSRGAGDTCSPMAQVRPSYSSIEFCA